MFEEQSWGDLFGVAIERDRSYGPKEPHRREDLKCKTMSEFVKVENEKDALGSKLMDPNRDKIFRNIFLANVQSWTEPPTAGWEMH